MTNLDEALQIARRCPALEYGMVVEVRPVAEQCPQLQRVNHELSHAAQSGM